MNGGVKSAAIFPVASSIRTLLASTALVAVAGGAFAQTALPTGGKVVSGQATISAPNGGGMVINQTSGRAIINWNGFSVGSGNSVRFENGTGATLNRVTGFSQSQIDGSLSASGSLYLVNPNGITVGPSGTVTTGGSFIASTHDVSDAAFLAGGDLTFRGASTAGVINYGTIGALGGDVALIAREVENAGTITAPDGTVGLAAGYEVLVRDLALSGGKFVVKVGGADTEAQTSGTIEAAEVELRANGGNIYALAGNTQSLTRATGVDARDGRIFLTAGDDGTVVASQHMVAQGAPESGKAKGGEIRVSAGTAKVSGKLEAKGQGNKGGTIVVTARDIALAAGAGLDASGTTGGLVLVGGDYQGGTGTTRYLDEVVQRAERTSIAKGATIRADGTAGAGGKVVVWSDEKTTFEGAISARGAGAARGGDAEVSGKALLDYRGTADLRSDTGRFGDLLLDPYNVRIRLGGSNMSGFDPVANDSVLQAGALTNALALANVTVTTGSSGTQAGNITVEAPIVWSSNSILTLQAAGAINIAADIRATGASAGLVLQHGAGYDYHMKGGAVTLTGANASLQIGTAGALHNYTLIQSMADLDNIDITGLGGRYAVVRDLAAGGTTYNRSVVEGTFTGTFAGLGHVISNLTIRDTSSQNVGLFSAANGSAIRDLGLARASVQGGSIATGALVGHFYDGTIRNSYASGSVSGNGNAGGLVGHSEASALHNVYATVDVTTSENAGGLVGYTSTGSITNAYATGTVTGSGWVGGLAGANFGSHFSNVYATGAVDGAGSLGGLVGYTNGGRFTNAFWDTGTTGRGAGIASNGGVVYGAVTAFSSSTAFSQGTYAGFDFANDWFMVDGSTRPFLRSEYSATIHNDHQLQLALMSLYASYTLGADINLAATKRSSHPSYTSQMWSSAGFVPIGNWQTPFGGQFDGLGHQISGLYIDLPTGSAVGLFGQASLASISNVGVYGASVRGQVRTGGLLGYASMDVSITNAYFSGGVQGELHTGGLVGQLDNRSKITNAYATGTVTGVDNTGGLVGALLGSSEIRNTYVYGTISVPEGKTGGGLVGQSSGTNPVTNSFWSTGSGPATSEGGTGLTTAQLKDINTFRDAGWDIDGSGGTGSMWRMYEGHSMPLLRSLLKQLTVSGGTHTKTYDGIAFDGAANAVYTGFAHGHTAANLGGTLIIGGTGQGALNAGNYVLSGLSGQYSDQQGYDIVYADGTLTIDKALLSVNYTSEINKTYDGTRTAHLNLGRFGFVGLVAGDDVSVSSASATYSTKDAGQNNVVSITDIEVTGASLGNYEIINTSAGTVGQINRAVVTAGLTGTVSKTYDGTTAASLLSGHFLLNGIIGGDAVTVAPVAGAYDTKDAGTGKTVTVSGLTLSGADAGNYQISSGAVSGTIGRIDRRSLTVGLTGTVSKTYDGTTNINLPTSHILLNGALDGDAVGVMSAFGVYDTKNAGAGKLVTVSGIVLYGADSGNYQISNPTVSGNIGQINRAILTAGLTGTVSKTYDGTTAASLLSSHFLLTGLQHGDVVTVAPVTGAYDTKNAGTGKSVTVSGLTLSGVDAGNYELASGAASGSIGQINRAMLTAGLTGTVSKTYDGTTAASLLAGHFLLTGVLDGEVVTVVPVTGAYDSKNAGTGKTVTVSGLALSGADAGNYQISSGAVSGNIGQINRRTLTAGLTGTVSKTYDGTTAASLLSSHFLLTGLLDGDAVSVTSAIGAYDTKNAGTGIGVTASGIAIGGGDAGNYQLVSTTASGNIGQINRRTLTAGLTGTVSKTYDGTTAASLLSGHFLLTGVLDGEVVTVAPVTGAYDSKNAGTGKTVTVSGLALSGFDAGNYEISSGAVSGAIGQINRAVLTAGLTGTVSKTYDGTTAAGLLSSHFLLSGVVGSDAVSVMPATGAYDTRNAGSNKTVTVSGLALSGADAGNYQISSGAISGNIGQIDRAALTVRVGNAGKTYNGLGWSGGSVTYDGFVNSETEAVLGGTLTYGGAAQGAVNAGTYAISASGQTSGNYAISYADGQLTVDRAALTVRADNAGKTYDGRAWTGGSVTYDGFVNGETDAVLGGTLTYGGAAQGAVNAGGYAITASGQTSSNYAISYADGLLTVARARLTVTADDVTKTYDRQGWFAGPVTYDGFVNGETRANLGGNLVFSGLAQGAMNAGSYSIRPLGLLSSNYDINYVEGTLTINKAPLLVSFNDDNTKRYDGTRTLNPYHDGFSLGGVITGDSVWVGSAVGTYATKDAQTGIAVTISNMVLTGQEAGNYVISNPTISTFGTILKATLTAGFGGSVGKTYDGTTAANLQSSHFTLTGLVGSDSVAVRAATGAYGDKNVGTGKSVSVSGLALSGADAHNYELASDTVSGNIGTIDKAALTVTVGNASKTYDGRAWSGGSVSYAGLVNGETAAVLDGTLVYGGTAQGAVNAGGYAISASGQTSGNYDITYAGGSLTVAKAALTVTTGNARKTYDGQAWSGGSVSYDGFVNGETDAVLGGSLVYGGTAQGAVNAGSHGIVASGQISGNYDITYVDGTLTVDRKSLTVTAGNASKTYDGRAWTGGAAPGVTFNGFVSGETEADLEGAVRYGGAAQGAVNAGRYAITAEGLSSGNYDITYVDGTLNVDKADLRVSVHDARKTYDGRTWSGGSASYAGFVNGESAAVLDGALAFGGDAQGARNAGAYQITASGLSSGNYDITYGGGTLNVDKARLTVTANSHSKAYDGRAWSGAGVSYAGFVNGESAAVLGGSLAFGGDAQGAVNAGRYSLTASGQTSGNYDIAYVGGTLNVDKARLTVTANDARKTYDGRAWSGGGASYAGFVNGESAAVLDGALAFGGNAQGAVNAGRYGVTASGLSSGNYDIAYVAGTLNVDKARLTVTAGDARKTYDGHAWTGGRGLSYSGFVNGEGQEVLGGELVYGGSAQGQVHAGRYVLSASGLSAANYDIAYVAGTLDIARRAITVRADAMSWVYGEAGKPLTYSVGGQGLVRGDTLSGALATQASATANAGRHAITQGTLAASSDYVLSYEGADVQVARRAITVTAHDFRRPAYGLPAVFTYDVGGAGLVNGDRLTGALASDANARSPAGTYAITQGSLAASSNYALTFEPGALTLTPSSSTPPVIVEPWPPGGPSTPQPGPGITHPGPGTSPTGPGTGQPGPGTSPNGPGTAQPGPGTSPTGPGTAQPGPGTSPTVPGTAQPGPGTSPTGPVTAQPGDDNSQSEQTTDDALDPAFCPHRIWENCELYTSASLERPVSPQSAVGSY
ncbi:YDG domain-containing protein [Xanthobacteraceae bacterium A53D]